MTAVSTVFRVHLEVLASGAKVVKIGRFYAHGKQNTRYYHSVTPSSWRRLLTILASWPELLSTWTQEA
jgi:hypothetical protein